MYKALLKRGFNEGYNETVAVKTLKGMHVEAKAQLIIGPPLSSLYGTHDPPPPPRILGGSGDPYICVWCLSPGFMGEV